MGNCRRIKILFKLLPFKFIQYFLLQRHILKCDEFLEDLVDIEEARAATIHKSGMEDVKNLWPQFLRDLEKEKQKKKVALRPVWRWALGTAGALALTFGFIFFMTQSPRKEDLNAAVKLTVDYVKIYEEPAQAFIFQTQDTSRTFVWVEKRSKGEMP